MTTTDTATHIPWLLSLEGGDLAATMRWLVEHVWHGATPCRVMANYETHDAGTDWLDAIGTTPSSTQAVYWDDGDTPSLVWYPGRCVAATFPFVADVPAMLAWLSTAPFQVAAFGNIHPAWEQSPINYRPPSFGANHFPLGWGCAFKGDGHHRLVSRRWLAHGPWKLRPGADDVSLVQFHDLVADAQHALAQARPGHILLGIGDESGFLQRNYVFEQPPSGQYSASERMLRIFVMGRSLTPVEMLDACAAKRLNALGPDKPLDRIAYVFADKSVAQAHLHPLYLRELECWAIVDGVERRLDEDYSPADASFTGW